MPEYEAAQATQEPTYDEIQRALLWSALMAKYAPRLKGERLQQLREMRDAKTTWIGANEVALSFAIDKHLRENDG